MHKYMRVAIGQDGGEVKSLIDPELIKKDMLHYLQDVRVLREMGRDLSNHHIVLCKVRLAGVWIIRKEVVNGARKIRSEKLREPQYREGYATSL